MLKPIVYEYPLNERIRQFLRLERLMVRIEHHKRANTLWDTQVCIQLLLELASYSNRGDLKNEVIKELERQNNVLQSLAHSKDINSSKVSELIEKQKTLIHALYHSDGRLSANIRNDELLNAVEQRMTTPGGGCDFDLPAYHQWLHMPLDMRQTKINTWLDPFTHIREAILLYLEVTRLSSETFPATAHDGYYEHKSLINPCIQLLRINLSNNPVFYPEISGSTKRFTVRFFEMQNTQDRPKQIKESVDFSISVCGL